MIEPLKYISSIFISLLSFSTANASCELNIVPINEVVISDYTGFDSAITGENIELHLSNSGSLECRGRLEFDALYTDGSLRNSVGEELRYSISRNRSLNGIIYDSKLHTVDGIDLTVAPNETLRLSLVLLVHPRQSGQSGNYQTKLSAIFRNKEMSEIDVPAIVPIAVEVKPTVQANFIGVTRTIDTTSVLNLGELYPGLQQRFGLQLRSNSIVDLQVSSENRGQLKPVNGTAGSVPYSLRVNGNDVNLERLDQISLPADLSTTGVTNPINIEIEEFENAAAGDYSDTLFIRISAR